MFPQWSARSIFFDHSICTCGSVRMWIFVPQDSTVTPQSLIDSRKSYVEPTNLIQSVNSFEESADPVNKWASEGMTTPLKWSVWQHVTRFKLYVLSVSSFPLQKLLCYNESFEMAGSAFLSFLLNQWHLAQFHAIQYVLSTYLLNKYVTKALIKVCKDTVLHQCPLRLTQMVFSSIFLPWSRLH